MAKGSRAVSKLRELFTELNKPLTIKDVLANTDLHPSEISMAFCYLLKFNYCTRVLIESTEKKSGRNHIYQYTYFPNKVTL